MELIKIKSYTEMYGSDDIISDTWINPKYIAYVQESKQNGYLCIYLKSSDTHCYSNMIVVKSEDFDDKFFNYII